MFRWHTRTHLRQRLVTNTIERLLPILFIYTEGLSEVASYRLLVATFVDIFLAAAEDKQ